MQKNIRNIRDYGAFGDGITDDTSAIREAVKSGEAIFFPPGTYILTKEIHVEGVDIHWYGAGDLSVIKLMPADTSHPKRYQGKTVFKTSMLFIEDGGELEFHNIKFDANKDAFKNDILQNGSTRFDHTVCIEIYGSKRFVLDGVTIANALIEGVYIYRTQNISVTKSKFIGNGYRIKDLSPEDLIGEDARGKRGTDASGMHIGGRYQSPPSIIISILPDRSSTQYLATVGLGRLSGSCDWATALVPRLREAGFITAAMALREDSIGLRDQRLGAADRLAIVLGTEGDGLLDSTIEACDYTVLVPMAHQVDSLNVSVAAGIAFWELGSASQI